MKPIRSAEDYNILGKKIVIQRKNLRLALKCFEKAISLDPDGFIYYSNAGTIYNKLEDYNTAVIFFSKVIELSEGTGHECISHAYKERGKAFYRLKFFDNAMKDVLQSIKINNKDYEAYYIASMICVVRGDYKNAVTYAEAALKLSPDNPYCDMLFSTCKCTYSLLVVASAFHKKTNK